MLLYMCKKLFGTISYRGPFRVILKNYEQFKICFKSFKTTYFVPVTLFQVLKMNFGIFRSNLYNPKWTRKIWKFKNF